jgi:hypothetical protein
MLWLYLWWWFWWQWPGASAARTAGDYQPSGRKCRCRACNFVFELLWQIHLHVWASCKSCNFSITRCRPTQVLHSQCINLLMKQYLQTTNNRWSLQMDHCYLLKKHAAIEISRYPEVKRHDMLCTKCLIHCLYSLSHLYIRHANQLIFFWH